MFTVTGASGSDRRIIEDLNHAQDSLNVYVI